MAMERFFRLLDAHVLEKAQERGLGESEVAELLGKLHAHEKEIGADLAEKGMPLPPTELLLEIAPITFEKREEREEPIEKIRQNLGNIEAFALTQKESNLPIEELFPKKEWPLHKYLWPRIYRLLAHSHLVVVGDILKKEEEQLLELRNFGRKSFQELLIRLVEKGFVPKIQEETGIKPEPESLAREEVEERERRRLCEQAEKTLQEIVWYDYSRFPEGSIGAELITILTGRKRQEGYFISGLRDVPQIKKLEGAGITTVEQLLQVSEAQLLQIKGIGRSTLARIREALKLYLEDVKTNPLEKKLLQTIFRGPEKPAPPIENEDGLRKAIFVALSSLPRLRENKVLMERYGLLDGRFKTFREMGKEFGVTRGKVKYFAAKALGRLRDPSRSKYLKDFLPF